jgi:hypothetical protein
VTEEEREQERVAGELRRIREQVRERALHARSPGEVLPAARALPEGLAPAPPAGTPPAEVAPRPDAGAVNAAWDVRRAPAQRGWRGLVARVLRRALGPVLDAQADFNGRQAQLDNALLDYLDARLGHTHRHYDSVLGAQGQRLADVDTRHLILQEELVAHVHDLVKRIDLVLAEAERGRVAHEFALKDLGERLRRLEERLARG